MPFITLVQVRFTDKTPDKAMVRFARTLKWKTFHALGKLYSQSNLKTTYFASTECLNQKDM